jgi:signal transduction histidine kinase
VLSHELKTPLTVITSFTQALKGEVLGSVTVDQSSLMHNRQLSGHAVCHLCRRLGEQLKNAVKRQIGTTGQSWQGSQKIGSKGLFA